MFVAGHHEGGSSLVNVGGIEKIDIDFSSVTFQGVDGQNEDNNFTVVNASTLEIADNTWVWFSLNETFTVRAESRANFYYTRLGIEPEIGGLAFLPVGSTPSSGSAAGERRFLTGNTDGSSGTVLTPLWTAGEQFYTLSLNNPTLLGAEIDKIVVICDQDSVGSPIDQYRRLRIFP